MHRHPTKREIHKSTHEALGSKSSDWITFLKSILLFFNPSEGTLVKRASKEFGKLEGMEFCFRFHRQFPS
jgi:hypothetical protein